MGDLQGKTILVVDDDRDLLVMVRYILEETGARVETAVDGYDAVRLASETRPDLVILDLMMPGIDGWETARRLQAVSEAQIFFLTAINQQAAVVRGLDGGAADFVTKPFSGEVLKARVRAALRRAPAGKQPITVYQDGYLFVDLAHSTVSVQGQPVSLTSIEHKLLALLVRNPDRLIDHEEILVRVWGEGCEESINYVHVYMRRLRQKLEPDPAHPSYILTEHGRGYRFQPARPAPAPAP